MSKVRPSELEIFLLMQQESITRESAIALLIEINNLSYKK